MGVRQKEVVDELFLFILTWMDGEQVLAKERNCLQDEGLFFEGLSCERLNLDLGNVDQKVN